MTLLDGHLEATGPDNPGAFAEFDKWVADRVAQRTAAMADVMKAAGLTVPLPGLADMKGQGTFFACPPYGTCWQPATSDSDDQQQAANKPSRPGPAFAEGWRQPAQVMQATLPPQAHYRGAVVAAGPARTFRCGSCGCLLSVFTGSRSLQGPKGSCYRQGKGDRYGAGTGRIPMGLGCVSRWRLRSKAASLCLVCRSKETPS